MTHLTKQEFFNLADKYASGKSTPEESKAFEEYFNAINSKESVISTWSLTKLEESRLRMINAINLRTRDEMPKLKHQRNAYKTYWAIAATIFLVLVSGWFFINSRQPEAIALVTKSTTHMQRSTLSLPDGTIIRLNIGSSISFPEEFSKTSRNVHLTGEAYFEVSKDPNRPFIISTGDIKTTVLGTAFNLRAYPNEDIDVTVTEGTVKVESSDNHQTLGVGEQAIYKMAKNQLTKNNVDVLDYVGWTKTEFTFDMVSFEKVVADLGRWYHKEITIEESSPSACLIRANLENNGLIPILSRLQNIVSFEYEKSEEEKILIKYNGCIN